MSVIQLFWQYKIQSFLSFIWTNHSSYHQSNESRPPWICQPVDREIHKPLATYFFKQPQREFFNAVNFPLLRAPSSFGSRSSTTLRRSARSATVKTLLSLLLLFSDALVRHDFSQENSASCICTHGGCLFCVF